MVLSEFFALSHYPFDALFSVIISSLPLVYGVEVQPLYSLYFFKTRPLVYENEVTTICCGYAIKSLVFDTLCSVLISKGRFGG